MKRIRKEKNYTQAGMATLLECSESNYQKIETGKISATIPMLMSIADKLETSMDYLARGNESCIDRRIERLLEGKSQEELEYAYRVLYVLLSGMPPKVKNRMRTGQPEKPVKK